MNSQTIKETPHFSSLLSQKRNINSLINSIVYARNKKMPARRTYPQARYWLLTINDSDTGESWVCPPELIEGTTWIRGQKEIGANSGRPHWQLVVAYRDKVRLARLVKDFPRCHAEPTQSASANDYVFKDETYIDGTRFELGEKPFNRSSKTDWALAKKKAQEGKIDDVPADVYIKYYRTLKQIATDHMTKPADLSNVAGIWIYGPPGVGKSHFARQHYGSSLYFKPQNKWWDGYQGEKNVLLDDFDYKGLGHHLKIWGDKYAFMAEQKGSSILIRPNNFIVTSNYSIEELFTEDEALCAAIKRRFYVIHLPMRMY